MWRDLPDLARSGSWVCRGRKCAGVAGYLLAGALHVPPIFTKHVSDGLLVHRRKPERNAPTKEERSVSGRQDANKRARSTRRSRCPACETAQSLHPEFTRVSPLAPRGTHMETSMAFASANGTAMIEPAFNPAAANSPRCRQGGEIPKWRQEARDSSPRHGLPQIGVTLSSSCVQGEVSTPLSLPSLSPTR